jgi:hypothetical protein
MGRSILFSEYKKVNLFQDLKMPPTETSTQIDQSTISTGGSSDGTDLGHGSMQDNAGGSSQASVGEPEPSQLGNDIDGSLALTNPVAPLTQPVQDGQQQINALTNAVDQLTNNVKALTEAVRDEQQQMAQAALDGQQQMTQMAKAVTDLTCAVTRFIEPRQPHATAAVARESTRPASRRQSCVLC